MKRQIVGTKIFILFQHNKNPDLLTWKKCVKDDIKQSHSLIKNHVNAVTNHFHKKESNDEKVHETEQKKTRKEIVGDSIVTGVEERIE